MKAAPSRRCNGAAAGAATSSPALNEGSAEQALQLGLERQRLAVRVPSMKAAPSRRCNLGIRERDIRAPHPSMKAAPSRRCNPVEAPAAVGRSVPQ